MISILLFSCTREDKLLIYNVRVKEAIWGANVAFCLEAICLGTKKTGSFQTFWKKGNFQKFDCFQT